ncbi:MAG: type II secretion system protein [Moraxellaceae bacterium]|nr:MAG: type II secretion system protein [Moraxellaceae bacterium]
MISLVRSSLKFSRFQKAFTLVEMLVVMVIVGLLITVIMQGFGYSMGMYQRVIRTQKNAYGEVLVYNWLRSTLGSQVAARPKDRGLEGNINSLSTYTYEPLVNQPGLKTRIDWRVLQERDAVSLEYREGNTFFAVYRWPESTAQFEYRDEKGEWLNHWPAEKSDNPPLPQSVRLLINTGKETRNYVVKVITRKRPEVTMDEVLNGR